MFLSTCCGDNNDAAAAVWPGSHCTRAATLRQRMRHALTSLHTLTDTASSLVPPETPDATGVKDAPRHELSACQF